MKRYANMRLLAAVALLIAAAGCKDVDAQQTSGEDYSGDWGERHDEELTGDAAQQTSGEAGEQAQAVDYASLPLDAEGYPVE